MNGTPSYEEALQFMADAQLYQRIDLTGPWQGWRIRGRCLVSPSGDRMTPERLRGLAWRMESEARLDRARARRIAAARAQGPVVTVLRVPLADWQAEQFGAAAS